MVPAELQSANSFWSGASGASDGATGARSLRLSEQDAGRVRGRRDGLSCGGGQTCVSLLRKRPLVTGMAQ